MKKMELLLNGEWRLLGTSNTGAPIDILATVPGYVHPALERANILPDMFCR